MIFHSRSFDFFTYNTESIDNKGEEDKEEPKSQKHIDN